MKNMNKKLLINLFSILFFASILISCAKKDNEVADPSLNNLFFDVVYNTKFYRSIGTSAWKNVEGIQQLKFTNNQGDTETGNLDSSSGTFTMFYSNYKEIGLLNATLCSGGYTGSFFSTATNGEVCGPEEVYNPNNPYNPCVGESEEENTNVDPITGQILPKDIYQFSFQLSVERRSLAQGCSIISPLEVVNYDITRITSNGDLIVKDLNRNIEFYMIPDVR